MLNEHKSVKFSRESGDLNHGWLIALRDLRSEFVLRPFPRQALKIVTTADPKISIAAGGPLASARGEADAAYVTRRGE